MTIELNTKCPCYTWLKGDSQTMNIVNIAIVVRDFPQMTNKCIATIHKLQIVSPNLRKEIMLIGSHIFPWKATWKRLRFVTLFG